MCYILYIKYTTIVGHFVWSNHSQINYESVRKESKIIDRFENVGGGGTQTPWWLCMHAGIDEVFEVAYAPPDEDQMFQQLMI